MSAMPGPPGITPVLLSGSTREHSDTSPVHAMHCSSDACLQETLDKPAAPKVGCDDGKTPRELVSKPPCAAIVRETGATSTSLQPSGAQLIGVDLTAKGGLNASAGGAPSVSGPVSPAAKKDFELQQVLITQSLQDASQNPMLPDTDLRQDGEYPALSYASSTPLQQVVCPSASGSQVGPPSSSTTKPMAAAAPTTTGCPSMTLESGSSSCTTRQSAGLGYEQPVSHLPAFQGRAALPALVTSPSEVSDSPEPKQHSQGLSPSHCSKSPTRASGDLIRQATASLYARIQGVEGTVEGSKQVVIPSSAKEKFKNAKARFDGVASVFQG